MTQKQNFILLMTSLLNDKTTEKFSINKELPDNISLNIKSMKF